MSAITSIRKGDGHPHLTYDDETLTLCGRVMHENRWAKIVRFDADVTAKLAAASLARPMTMFATCARCMRVAGVALDTTEETA